MRKSIEKQKFTHPLKVTLSIGVAGLNLLQDVVDFLLSKADSVIKIRFI
jgi:PleD family two-component response regulator